MFQIGSSPHGKYGLVAAGSHIFPWTAPDFYLKYFHKSNTALCCILSGGAERTRILRKAGRRWRKNSDQSIDGWLQLFCFFLEENHAWRRQQFIALVGQSNGKLESFVSLQLCKYWCYRRLLCGMAAHLVVCAPCHTLVAADISNWYFEITLPSSHHQPSSFSALS